MKMTGAFLMKILAIEFCSEERSVAIVERLSGEQSQLRGSAFEKGGRSAHAFALIEQALQQAQMEREEIECVAVGLGPGSYTGIRAAIAFAQGWQLAREIKLVGISSVECLAAQSFANGTRGRANFIIDAQRNEFYSAAYEINESGFSAIEPLHLATFAEVEKRAVENQFVFGPDVMRLFPGAQDLFPNATALGQLACKKTDFVSGEKMEPIYLREVSFVKAPPPRVISY
ncbi:MAG: tRNA (adenosine(37)-N6)-threonylcarbamoyltransferase complex dimerization subunit type 1 TsaB [Verrucomicrobiota bacterium]